MQVTDPDARKLYESEARSAGWNVRTLQRNISTQYYYRLLKSSDPDAVEKEMQEKTSPYYDKLDFIKNPYIAEFLGMQENPSFQKSDLENSILSNLQQFLMELIARYSVLHGNEQLLASKYKLYLPSDEELRAEIETQKELFYLQHNEDADDSTSSKDR